MCRDLSRFPQILDDEAVENLWGTHCRSVAILWATRREWSNCW